MCLSETHCALPPPLVRDTDDAKTFTNTLGAMACRPSWTLRGVFKPTSTGRPGLPRRFHTKINLNEYWGVLEKLVKVDVSFPNRSPDAAPTAQQQPAMDVDNEVNDNLANERAEQKMEVDQEDDDKADDKDDDKGDTEITEVTHTEPSPALSPAPSSAPSPAREKGHRHRPRKTPPPQPAPACTAANPPGLACGSPAPSPRRRTPLGTLNGMQSRDHLNKNLSPLSVFADNLARRLSRQY